MNLELDHFFILTDKPKEAGDLLAAMGIQESFSRDHAGQGTSNRRFEFSNGMLEILYVRDREEASNGPAKNLRFAERVENPDASPFGIILSRTDDTDLAMPFSGWKYQPDYLTPPMAFHIGSNSEILEEPLCIYAPFIHPLKRTAEKGLFRSVSRVRVAVPVEAMSDTLLAIRMIDRLQIERGDEHLITLTLDKGQSGRVKDLRPVLPLLVRTDQRG